MRTIGEIFASTEQFFSEKSWAHPRKNAREVLAVALKMEPLDLYLHFDRPLTQEEVERCREVLKERITLRPLAYIEGRCTFYQTELQLTDRVLIPRQETEILVDSLVKRLKSRDSLEILDVGTGSGCIAIALKKALPHLKVTASDLCLEALAVARENAAANGVEITFVEGDFLLPFMGNAQFDLIISNPPYISLSEYLDLSAEVRAFEPKKALLASPSGLEFYERMKKELPSVLKEGGEVWVEIGATQGQAVSQLFMETGFEKVEVLKDWANHDRFVKGENLRLQLI